MRLMFLLLAALAAVPAAAASDLGHTITSNGVRVTAPAGWHSVRFLGEDSRNDPHTVLVVGTKGVTPSLTSGCQIAAYTVRAEGAVVVVVRWRTLTSGGGTPKTGRSPLKTLTRVSRPSFECFKGRGAAAQLVLRGKPYQVNVMVGDRATPRTVSQALVVARSFDLAP